MRPFFLLPFGLTPGLLLAQSPTLPGQDAYASMAEVVRILEADRTTDWSKVNLEALRQHLIDMNDVTLRSMVKQSPIAGGATFDVTGEGRTAGAIRRMLTAHAPMLDMLPDYAATAVEIPGGTRLTVRAKRNGDSVAEARIRGLGFIGMLTVGAHHPVHHMAIARGEAAAHGH